MAGNIKIGGQFPGGGSGGGSGTVSNVVVQGGPFLNNATITSTGTIGNSVTSLTAHGVLLGEGTGAVGATAAMTNGQLLIGATGADPAPQTVSGDATLAANGAITVSKVGGVAPATVAGLGLNLNAGGTISAHSQITVAATTGLNTITLAASTTNVMINGPASGGAVTLALTGAVAIDQRVVMNVSQAATAATWAFGTGFNFGTTVPTPTITALAGKRDTMMLINNVGTVFDFDAIVQGFSP